MTLIALILAITAVILCGVVFVALWGRIIADEGRIDAALGSKDDIARIDNSQKLSYDEIAKLRSDIISLQESLSSIGSKWANRIKADEARERRAAERAEAAAAPEVPALPEPENGKPKKSYYRLKQFA